MALGRPGRPMITPLGRFASAVRAAEAHGLSASHCHARAKRQIGGWRFEDEQPRFRRKWAIAVATPDGDFKTVSAAARHHGICCATVEARIRRCEPGWRYTDPVASGQRIAIGIAPIRSDGHSACPDGGADCIRARPSGVGPSQLRGTR